MTSFRRRAASCIVATIALASVASPALAHASFDKSQVPAEAEIDLTFNAPQERASTNARIEALAPWQFKILTCVAPDGWTCELDTTSNAPDTVVIWNVGGDALLPVSAFPMRVRTPNNDQQGVYAWPVIQTYADGFEAEWIGEQAPTIQVGDSDAPVVDNTEAPDSHREPSPQPTRSPAASPTPGASGSPTTKPAAQADPAASATPSEDAVEPTTPARVSVTDAASSTKEPEGTVALVETDSGGGRPLGLLAAVLLLAVAGAAGFVLRGRKAGS